MGGHVHIFHEKPTFYFSPVDGHLCYGDLETLGDIQELHIKSPVTGKRKDHSSCSTAALQWIQCFVAIKNRNSCALTETRVSKLKICTKIVNIFLCGLNSDTKQTCICTASYEKNHTCGTKPDVVDYYQQWYAAPAVKITLTRFH